MGPNPHDIWEALYQAPGEQLVELSDDLDRLRKEDDLSREEIVRKLRFHVARMREIAPVIEMLHEAAEINATPRSDELDAATDLMEKQQPPFAAVLLFRLAAARAAGESRTAGNLRDDIATYARRSQIENVRDVLINGLRLDAFEHGETKPGYYIARLEDLREQALSCVPEEPTLHIDAASDASDGRAPDMRYRR